MYIPFGKRLQFAMENHHFSWANQLNNRGFSSTKPSRPTEAAASSLSRTCTLVADREAVQAPVFHHGGFTMGKTLVKAWWVKKIFKKNMGHQIKFNRWVFNDTWILRKKQATKLDLIDRASAPKNGLTHKTCWNQVHLWCISVYRAEVQWMTRRMW